MSTAPTKTAPVTAGPHYVPHCAPELVARKGDDAGAQHPDEWGHAGLSRGLMGWPRAPKSLWLVRAHMHGDDGEKIYGPEHAFFVWADDEAEMHEAISKHLQVSIDHARAQRRPTKDAHPLGAVGVARAVTPTTRTT